MADSRARGCGRGGAAAPRGQARPTACRTRAGSRRPVIYVDTSVVMAQLLAEDVHPDPSFWEQGPLVSSRLLEYEVWTRVNGRRLGATHGEDVRLLLGRLAFLELAPPVLARATEPFPTPVRTLDALHLASIDFLRGMGSGRRWRHTTGVCPRPRPRSTYRSSLFELHYGAATQVAVCPVTEAIRS